MEAFLEINLSDFFFNYVAPCILACICGGIIGFEREKIDRPAGLRTHTLVCLGATIFTLVSYLGFHGDFDPSRVAAGIVAGIGFIGAGVIFRQGVFVKGVTTAASIWVVAAVGIAIGTRLYYLAIIATILTFCILTVVKLLEDRLQRKTSYTINVVSDEDFEQSNEFIEFLETFNTKVTCEKCKVKRITSSGEKKISTQISLESKDPEYSKKILEIIKRFKSIDRIEII